MLRIVLLVGLTVLASAVLEVYSPISAKSYFTSPIQYSVANFGHIPFGKSIIGPLYQVKPEEGCDFDKLEAVPSSISPFLLIKRGSCNFVKKVYNAYKLGAKLAIIVDNIPEYSAYLTMKDDGTGYRVKIPSILISEEDGNKLRKQINNNVSVVMKMTFYVNKADKANMILWLEANNRYSYHIVREFAKYYEKLKDYIDLTIVHHTILCYFCRSTDCYGEGMYCAVNPDARNPASGRDIIRQQLREQIVFEMYPDKWWSYMDKYDLECDYFLQAEVCSDKLFDKLGIDKEKVRQAVKESIESNSRLEKNKKLLDGGGVIAYPSVSINSLRLPGNLRSSYIVEEICSSLNRPPIRCAYFVYIATDSTSGETHHPAPNYGWTIALVLLIVSIFFGIAFCLAKRCIRRQITVYITSQVNETVSRYVEFYSDRNKPPV